MSTLFDVSPEEPTRRRGKRQVGNAVPTAPEVPSDPRIVVRPPIGRYDEAVCADESCGASAHDVLDEVKRAWLLECCLCGVQQWVPAIAGYLKPREEEWRFHEGLFAGLSIAEARLEPRGADYLKWAAESHPRPIVREAVKKWIASNPGGL